MADRYGLRRFRNAQDFGVYEKALEEVKSGLKMSYWIWFIFPQIRGFGHSRNTCFYGITCADEAREYLADPVFGSRLGEICQALLDGEQQNPHIIFRDDAVKVRSCLTLFDYVSPNDIFGQVLDRMYMGSRDLESLTLIRKAHQ